MCENNIALDCIVCNSFSTYFSYIKAISAPLHVFCTSNIHNIMCHWLLSHILLFIETMDSSETGVNHVPMTIINPRKEYCPSLKSNLQPPVFKSCRLQAELYQLGIISKLQTYQLCNKIMQRMDFRVRCHTFRLRFEIGLL